MGSRHMMLGPSAEGSKDTCVAMYNIARLVAWPNHASGKFSEETDQGTIFLATSHLLPKDENSTQ